jgi:PIN domain nuclease of toxin-antitoxin system
MIVLDTHVLLWWVSSPEKLSPEAVQALKKEQAGGLILISAITVWEINMLISKNRLNLNVDIETWLEEIESIPFIQFVPIDNQIAMKSVNLPGEFHKDPADRIIVATARENEATLITNDDKIKKYPNVRTIW